ncbi:hypothetical protein AVEN_182917-1 [Araneus ventricosus]|uniref:Uncharacterized protein n=1 Tax=Araneus ventricosus TaxID=182803 RepID=A0A4Y2DNL2_ARAVE|nr:hypothetical protein AVEN_102778-1 [Araneus ventricosus]GBM17236.1 hypothetical protein AVEN_69789-1 [Araneus ventricosus]GBM17249.1 hypothetical protein AVEN_116927-1 [Araneus ventricosus]GBM17275.1 hypothetical protein AVEN_182917-1 [Araneus ventricosus]
MIPHWLLPQIQPDRDDFMFIPYSVPPHFYHEVRQHLNYSLLTHSDFYLWGYLKDSVYVPLIPASLQDLRDRIVIAMGSITRDQLLRVQEIDYRFDSCRITSGDHVKCIE